MINKIKIITKKTFEFIIKLCKNTKSLITKTTELLADLPCKTKSLIKKTIIFLKEADCKTKIKIIISIVLVIYLYNFARILYIEHKFGKFEIVEMPNNKTYTDVVKLNDDEILIIDRDHLRSEIIYNFNTNEFYNLNDPELANYVVFDGLPTNKIYAEKLVKGESGIYQNIYPYIYDMQTKEFKKIGNNVLDGELIWLNDSKYLHLFPPKLNKKYYEICNLEIPKCDYGGVLTMENIPEYIKLDDTKLYMHDTKDVSYIYDIKSNILNEFEFEPPTRWDFGLCGNNLICFYGKYDFYSLIKTNIYIEKYKLEDNELKFVKRLKTNLHQTKPYIIPFGPSNRYAFVIGGYYGGYLFFPEFLSKKMYFLDTKTGKTTKYKNLPLSSDVYEWQLDKNRWLLYCENFSKMFIFTTAKKLQNNK